MPTKSLGCKGCDLGNKVQVVGRGNNGDVTHVQSELGQLCLHVAAFAITATENLDGKGMSEIVHAWATAVGTSHPSQSNQFPHRLTDAYSAEGMPAPMAIGVNRITQKGGRRLQALGLLESFTQIPAQLSAAVG